jgi:hypothetical protein
MTKKEKTKDKRTNNDLQNTTQNVITFEVITSM